MLTLKYLLGAMRIREQYCGPDLPIPYDHVPHSNYITREIIERKSVDQQRRKHQTLNEVTEVEDQEEI